MWHHERGKIVHWLTSCFFTRGSSVNAIRNSCMQHKKPETKRARPSGSIYQSQVLCCLLLINTKTQCKKNWRVELALAAIDCTVFGFPTEMLHIWKLLLVTLTKHFAQQNITQILSKPIRAHRAPQHPQLARKKRRRGRRKELHLW